MIWRGVLVAMVVLCIAAWAGQYALPVILANGISVNDVMNYRF